MLEDGAIRVGQRDRAEAEAPTIVQGHRRPWRAPRFVDRVLDAYHRDAIPDSALMGPREIRTSLHWPLQAAAEEMLSRTVDEFAERGVTNAAAVVVHNETAQVLAYVAAAKRGASASGGMLDLLRARRQPGSTLKPFVYEQLFERGATAATVLADITQSMTDYDGALFEAQDYDGQERGPVRARIALAGSLNLAALDAARRVGPTRLLRRLRTLGFDSLQNETEHGIGIVLGGGDVQAVQLARAYLTLARDGQSARLRSFVGDYATGEEQLNNESVAIIRSILRDRRARERAFGGHLEELAGGAFALKTGTSSGWRDAWAAAFDDYTTVVVWLGDPAGAPLGAVSGFEAAAPAAARLLALARPLARQLDKKERKPIASLVRTHVCPLSGARPGPNCSASVPELFVEGTEPDEPCPFHSADGIELPARYAHWLSRGTLAGARIRTDVNPAAQVRLRITAPRDRAELLVDSGRTTSVELRAQNGDLHAEAEWWVDGRRLESNRYSLQPGRHTLQARWQGQVDEIVIEVREAHRRTTLARTTRR